MTYTPPVADMLFTLYDVLGAPAGTVDRDTAQAILEEAAKLASEELAPLNHPADKAGAKWTDGAVSTAPGFKDFYERYRQGGWNAVPFPADYGGQGLPWAIAFPVQEMWQAANMSFGLCPLLNQGAIEAILHHGNDEQKAVYLPNLISGAWTGTMNLTEPQAGSDLGLIRSKAEKQSDGTYRISGQKIFITYGEHDLTDNIIHLVLARTTDAPADVKGISLFIVPKFLKDGTRNDVRCTGIEHKLGIHASPTCTMQFGDAGGAVGYLVGQEHQGLKYMFTMMNNARLSVGLQGVAIAERSYQHALAYAQGRQQGKDFATGQRVSIAHHADVRRMLLSMQSHILAARALTYEAALAIDASTQDVIDILTPIVKAYSTDMACEVASLGVQIHGGMGFVEETGAAQYYRDARILPIYEGTNGIQAADLIFRKLLRDEGKTLRGYIATLRTHATHDINVMDAFTPLEKTTEQILIWGKNNQLDLCGAAAAPYLKGLALVAGAVMLLRMK
ncbi:MAG: acyl-CoA dehydrogenase, partial [Alphaproteobacteria bacterium]|nr:acyl-CoA dehydrogenase [Alphaproteobacteria bacterium]